MGSSQSSRKLTIANEEEEGNVIKISDAVAKRLTENAAAAAAQQQQQPAKTPVSVSTAAVAPKQVKADAECYPQYTISALEIKQQKEQEIKEQEQYWKQRLNNLERNHNQINKTFDEEYKKALHYFDDSRETTITKGTVRPCNDNKKKVLKCLKDNPKETLRCSDLVQQFSNCVDQRRANLTKCN